MRRLAGAAVPLAALAGPAAAHGALADGGFVGGALHPVVAVQHLLLLLALGLLLGPLPREARGGAFLATALGLVAGLGARAAGVLPPLGLALPGAALVLGLLLAAGGRGATGPRLAALAGVAALLVGLDTDAPVAAAPLAGVAAGVALIVLDACALSGLARAPWQVVARRVAGSWIAAVSLMLMALALARGGAAA